MSLYLEQHKLKFLSKVLSEKSSLEKLKLQQKNLQWSSFLARLLARFLQFVE